MMAGTWDHDVYRDVNKKRVFELPLSQKRLGNIESLAGIKEEREIEALPGLESFKALQKYSGGDYENYVAVMIHNLNDAESTLDIARKITVPSKVWGDVFGG